MVEVVALAVLSSDDVSSVRVCLNDVYKSETGLSCAGMNACKAYKRTCDQKIMDVFE